ncbi:MAG: hypothetical protein HQL10_00955 [Nitrospirae bacterium]|nr:hypothetical protein [Nitrospirota bacterium]
MGWSRYNRYSGFPEYVTVGEKKAKAEKKLKELLKKNPNAKPVLIKGSAIARTWWGKAWNKNLEQYADYSNRIGRGRSYVRHGAVLDLQIAAGSIQSLVQGSSSKPYSVEIKITPLNSGIWQTLISECQGMIDSIHELFAGTFSSEIGNLFIRKEAGLFPAPKEIRFNCSCPDWADMCKHVAATLYGVGARLDENPALFFVLRNKEMDELIHRAVLEKAERLISKTPRKGARIIEDADISSVFGIEMEETVLAVKPLTDKEKEKNAPIKVKAKNIKKKKSVISKNSTTAKTKKSTNKKSKTHLNA